ncbi:sulfate permease [Enterococcus hirae 57-03-H11]|uniref:SulP family inorganic anion transporter n=1 Tax=Enterococcus TaxID=1350 RepID=UPI000B539A91|nr:SulP family inorganic anion transporter [Enterococcus hirae]OWW68421.1 sulfate permease [Enterococcus hirae 57-03-H11]EMF0180399.1 SulP family inorganic anion transporter [Enterococcus hirae]EMF0196058.1 SulP family inorganic anion transporter [Enterococcus hirae]EMF0203878.1 SulP family inorganic anion transporter [Enterococcus hirae]EMF0462461.1 SulP family inorganic anion transporter [Enterococcus hirae]
MFKKYIFLLNEEFDRYDRQKFQKDLLAGITVAAVALPLALAFGVSSGANAAAGLITAVIAGLIIGGLSGGFYQISGPTGAMAAILMSIAATQGMSGVLLATFLAGLLLLVAGIFRLGTLTSFIPAPVITGFTSGIAIIIALGQVDNLFGVHSEGANVIEKFLSYQTFGFSINFSSFIMGLLVIIGMIIYPKKWAQTIPSSLMAIILATVAMFLFHLPIATVGKIPQTLISSDRLTFAAFHLDSLKEVMVPAISIALLGMVESLLCGASAGRMANKPLDSNQELVAQGIGNLVLPFFGGIPATAAIARTSVAIKSGAQTRLAGIIHALVLFLSMIIFAPIMSNIPMPALAGVLIVTAWRMNEWETINVLFTKRYWSGILLFLITMGCTVIFDLSIAIVIGIIGGCIFFVIKSAAITISVETIDWERMDLPETKKLDNWTVVYISGPLFFMSAEKLKNTLADLNQKEGIIFSMRGVPSIDLTARAVFDEFQEKAEMREQTIIYTSLQPEVEKQLQHLWQKAGFEQHQTVAHALSALHEQYT